MTAHPAERAELEAATRRRVLAWAAAEGLRVSPAAADRLVARLAGATSTSHSRARPVEQGARPAGEVVALAAYRDRPLPTRG